MSESKRQLKFAKLIRKEISEILQREYSGRFTGSLVTVSDVSMSPDLGLARTISELVRESAITSALLQPRATASV